MSRRDIFHERAVALGQGFLLVLDLLCNLLVSLLLLPWSVATGQLGQPACAYETMSARAGRALLNGKPWAHLLVPFIDFLFFWQSHELVLPDGRVVRYASHCFRAYLKTFYKLNLPPEYRGVEPLRGVE